MTLRQIAVRLRHLPPDASTQCVDDSGGWTRSEFLLTDIFRALTGRPHPARPKPTSGPTPQRQRKLRAAKARARARAAAIESGEIS